MTYDKNQPSPAEPVSDPAPVRDKPKRGLFGAPRPALFLTIAGVLPFLISALVVVVTPRGILFNETAYASLLTYSAVILGFLGGTRWGAEIALRPQETRWPPMVLAILPPLIAWLTIVVGLQARPTLAVLTAAFIAMLVWDLWSISIKTLPGWYAPLRIIASAGAILSLLLVLWTRGPMVTPA